MNIFRRKWKENMPVSSFLHVFFLLSSTLSISSWFLQNVLYPTIISGALGTVVNALMHYLLIAVAGLGIM
jgi:hypothetical protein